MPAVLLTIFLFLGKKPFLTNKRITLAYFDKLFLLCAALGPFLLTLLISMFSGMLLRAAWGMPLLSFWGILLFAGLQPQITLEKWRRFLTAVFLLFILLVSGYSISLIRASAPSSANFPGQLIADTVTKLWHDSYHTRLAYVAGPRWVNGNILAYSADKPAVFMDWNPIYSPWINIKDMRQKGAIFAWLISDEETLPFEVKKQFPKLAHAQIIYFPWLRNNENLPPIKVGIAFLPPSHKS